MNKIRLIAVTGGIGSGKTAVTEFIKAAGYPVVSCDEITAELYRNEEFLTELAKVFPQAIKKAWAGENERLIADKKEIAEEAFSCPDKYEKLNTLVTEKVFSCGMERAKKLAETGKNSTAFIEVPLLFENGYEKFFDNVIVVKRDVSARVAAVKARSGLSEKEIADRIEKQYDYASLPPFATVIENEGDLTALKKATTSALEKMGL